MEGADVPQDAFVPKALACRLAQELTTRRFPLGCMDMFHCKDDVQCGDGQPSDFFGCGNGEGTDSFGCGTGEATDSFG